MDRADRPRFRYNSYWGTWSLLLTTRHRVGLKSARPGLGCQVEIDLSPVNGWGRCTDLEVERVVGLNLRVHCTAPCPRDRLERDLPVEMQVALAAHLGWDLVAWLLDPATEILGLVNWAKHTHLSNGGASLRASAWGHLAHLIPEAQPSETMQDLVEYMKAA